MFRLTTKVKVAGGLTAGALILGGAGAYAANGGAVTVANPQQVSLPSGTTGGSPLQLITLNGATSLTPPSFDSRGACVSWFAQNRQIALQPSGFTAGTTNLKLAKNYHGKLMSSKLLRSWCDSVVKTTAGAVEPQLSETPDATESEAPDASSASGNGRGHGHGHGHGAAGSDD